MDIEENNLPQSSNIEGGNEENEATKMFAHPFSFNGRIRRLEFVLSYIIIFAINIIGEVITDSSGASSSIDFLIYCILSLISFWFHIAQGAKRCHDFGLSGWFQLIPFFYIYMLFQDGDPGENDWGANPKGIQDSEVNEDAIPDENENENEVQELDNGESNEEYTGADGAVYFGGMEPTFSLFGQSIPQKEEDDCDNENEQIETAIQEPDPEDFKPMDISEYKRIEGWLILFLIAILSGGAMTLFLDIIQIDSGKSTLLNASYLAHGISFMLFSIYTFYCFKKRKSNAVFLGKCFVTICLLNNLLLLISYWKFGVVESDLATIRRTAYFLFCEFLWFFYLCYSEQVARIYPKENRKHTLVDWGIVLFVFFAPSILCIYSLTQTDSTPSSKATPTEMAYIPEENLVFSDEDCSPEEITDGNVMFKKPAGNWEKRDSLYCDNPIFIFDKGENSEKSQLRFFSTPTEGSPTKAEFEIFWDSYTSLNIPNSEITILSDEELDNTSTHGWRRTAKITSDMSPEPIYRDMVIIADVQTEKKVFFNYESTLPLSMSPIPDLCKSIKFHK